ncbi:LuxR C-terminal-related transcriptional regulator [Streptomyces sp. NPDC050095]|uniref:LuxR C-terminal-related transcriptional regulator n=1 Tax=unclassified Streptomyces TaxID=2593676 RepID=UPI003415B70E
MTRTTSRNAVQQEVLGACEAGRSGVVLVEGAVGCGKSTLLDRVAARAGTAGALVLTATATGRHRPLDVLLQLVRSAPAFALSGAGRADDARRLDTAGNAFCAELRALSRKVPLTLCVDDVHKADPQSLSHLQYVARYAHPAKITLAVTATAYGRRRDEVFPSDVLRRRHVQQVRLDLLTPDDVVDVLAALGGAPVRGRRPAAMRLHGLSGGNPLLLRALLAEDAVVRQPTADGPFGRAVADCLHRSGPAALETARALAVLGDSPAERTVLAALVNGGAYEALAGLSALRACGLLDALGRREPVVRAAALAGCDAVTLAQLRVRAAHALRAAGAPATAVAAPLLALRDDDEAGAPVQAADRELMALTSQTLLDEGRALRERGSLAQGDALLRAADTLVKQAGRTAPRPAATARPLSATTRSVGLLNRREQRVAQLAAEGLTNRQIAAGMCMAVSTVEHHLTRIYRKLRVRGRDELTLGLVGVAGQSLSRDTHKTLVAASARG